MLKVRDLLSDKSRTVANLKQEIYNEIGRNYNNNRFNTKKFIQKIEKWLEENVFDPIEEKLKTGQEKNNELMRKRCLIAVRIAKGKTRIMCSTANKILPPCKQNII